MNIKAKILSAFIASATAVTSIGSVMPSIVPDMGSSVQVSAAESDKQLDEASGLYYKKIDEDDDGTYDYVEITGCDELATEIEIPAEIDGLLVTSIGARAFYDCDSLADITISDSVTSIGSYAFCGCSSLTSIGIVKKSAVVKHPKSEINRYQAA